jgi:hypothetical protein
VGSEIAPTSSSFGGGVVALRLSLPAGAHTVQWQWPWGSRCNGPGLKELQVRAQNFGHASCVCRPHLRSLLCTCCRWSRINEPVQVRRSQAASSELDLGEHSRSIRRGLAAFASSLPAGHDSRILGSLSAETRLEHTRGQMALRARDRRAREQSHFPAITEHPGCRRERCRERRLPREQADDHGNLVLDEVRSSVGQGVGSRHAA